jgi:hypothetical protein
MPVVKFSAQKIVGNSFRGRNLNDSIFFKARLKNVWFDFTGSETRTLLRRIKFSEFFTRVQISSIAVLAMTPSLAV